MRKVIWKYELITQDTLRVLLPIGAEILALQTQNEKPCVWFLVNPDEVKTEVRKFDIVSTGHTIYDANNKKYIGTYQLQGGLLVFHVFEYKL